jgi:hypothetical protein
VIDDFHIDVSAAVLLLFLGAIQVFDKRLIAKENGAPTAVRRRAALAHTLQPRQPACAVLHTLSTAFATFSTAAPFSAVVTEQLKMPNYSHTNYGDNPEFRRKSQKVFVDRLTNDVVLRLHETDIVRVRPNGDVILCTGGWATHKTMHSMNDALELMDMWVESSGNIPRGNWLVYDSDGSVIPYDNDKINYVITIPGKSSEARQRAQWLAEAYNVAYTPGGGQPQQPQGPRPRVMSGPPPPVPQQAAAAAQPPAMAWPAGVPGPPRAAANGTLSVAQAAGRAGAGSWAKIVKPEPPPAPAAAAAAVSREFDNGEQQRITTQLNHKVAVVQQVRSTTHCCQGAM